MRVSSQFILRSVAGEHLLIPVGEAAMTVRGLIAMSESGAMLYEKLKTGCTGAELIVALMEEYEISEEVAARDTEDFLNQMRQLHILEEE